MVVFIQANIISVYGQSGFNDLLTNTSCDYN
jgi:hypothetical protein